MTFERSSALYRRAGWREALHDLALSCRDDDRARTPERLQEMNALLVDAPDVSLLEGLRAVSPVRMEALLKLGAWETAALSMLDDGARYMLSRSDEQRSLATVVLPTTRQEKTSSGSSPALAIVGALALALSCGSRFASLATLRPTLDVAPSLH